MSQFPPPAEPDAGGITVGEPSSGRRAQHDSLFKQLLHTCFADFLRLFVPEAAAKLDLESITFLEQELLSAPLLRETREDEAQSDDLTRLLTDLVATIPERGIETPAPRQPPALVCVHVEIQGQADPTMDLRMFTYWVELRRKYQLPVFPIVFYPLEIPRSFPQKEGTAWLVWEERALDFPITTFRYLAIGLARLPAETYLAQASPLAAGLATLMQPPAQMSRAALKVACLARIRELAGLSDEVRRILVNLVYTYPVLPPSEQQQFHELAQRNEGVRTMEKTYFDVIAEQSREQGLQQGMHDLLRAQLVSKFGELPEETRGRLEAIQDTATLHELATRLLSASSLAELGLQ